MVNQEFVVQRKGRDMDPVRPWQWADMPLKHDPVEIVSYPIPAEGKSEIDNNATIMVRMTVGDPTSIREVPFRLIACFCPSRHEWYYRTKRYYNDNPTAFVFSDETGR